MKTLRHIIAALVLITAFETYGQISAGPDQTICQYSTAVMAGSGSGWWASAVANPTTVTFTNDTLPITTATGFDNAGLYTIIYSNGVTSDTMMVTVIAKPNAGPDQTICQYSATNMIATGTGIWTISVGNPAVTTIANDTSPITLTSGYSVPGIYAFYWTENGCTDTVLIHVTAKPDAGPDQAICEGSTVTMAATGMGMWTTGSYCSIITVVSLNSPVTQANGFTCPGVVPFYWTDNGCSDTMIVTVNAQPNAGPDQYISLNDTVTMAAMGTGTWTQLSTNPISTTITNPLSPTTTMTGFSVPGVYGYAWSSGVCLATDTVYVFITPAGPNQTICQYSYAVMNAYGSGTWSGLASNPAVATIDTPSSPTSGISGFTSPGVYSFVWTMGAGSDTMTVTVNAPVMPSVLLSASGISICSGMVDTFTATPTNGGTSPSYQWYNDGTAVGANAAMYVTSTLSNQDSVWVVMTSNATCAAPDTALSNKIHLTINPTVIPAISISATSISFCGVASADTFTATPTNGGAVPSYQWYKDGTAVGANAAMYVTSALANQDSVWVVMTSNATCASPDAAVSNKIHLTINPTVIPAVSLSATSISFCGVASADTFTATPTNGGTSPSYQWYKDGTAVGANAAMYVTSALANQDSVWVVMTSNATCASPDTAVSNKIHLTINPTVIPAISISATSISFCGVASADTFTATPNNGGIVPSYQWYNDGTAVGTNAATFITSALSNNDSIWAVMTSNVTCAAPDMATSNKIHLTINPVITPTVSISAAQTGYCALTATDTFTATGFGGGTSPSYQWYKDGATAGVNSDTLIASALSNSDSIWLVMTSNAICASPLTATSNKIHLIIAPCSTDSVWPGDADNNHVVDNNDLLPIGLGYGSTGPVRAIQGIVWQGDAATDWTDSFANYAIPVNYKFADCNGDSVIDARDTAAIMQNFSLTHAKTNGFSQWRTSIPALKAVLSRDTLYTGDTLYVTFVLGDSVTTITGFYGLAFTYNYDPIVMDSAFTSMTFDSSWVGADTDKISISKIIGNTGQIMAAVTRIDHVARSGSGPLAVASFKITTDNISGKDFSYYANLSYISDITLINQMGQVIPLNAGADSSTIAFIPNGIRETGKETLHIYPNPARDRVYITAESSISEITFVNVLGQEVMSGAGTGGRYADMDISAFVEGLYFVQVSTAKGTGMVKMIVVR